MKRNQIFLSVVLLLLTASTYAGQGLDATLGYEWMTQLYGDWKLAAANRQEAKATTHELVAPIVGTDQTAMAFKTIGKGSTVQEDLLPGNKK